jgi:hypothetical protein
VEEKEEVIKVDLNDAANTRSTNNSTEINYDDRK